LNESSATKSGLLYGLVAYLWWGFMPWYFSVLGHFPPSELLAHRIVWSVLWVGLLITTQRGWGRVGAAFADRRTLGLLSLSTLLIALNWITFLRGVVEHRVLETSLGYFITPLFSVLLGILVYDERLRRLQWLAVAFAAVGVGVLLVGADRVPWIALTLMLSFGCYGLVRKQIAIDGVTGLFVETLLLVPICVAYLGYLQTSGQSSMGKSLFADVMVVMSGAMTAVPLICFAQAVVRLKLSTMGFLQYISPSMQFVVALAVLGETFTEAHGWSFGLIWVGLALFIADALRQNRARNRASAYAS